MRLSKGFFVTLRDDPREAEIVSHKLMMRSLFIRKHAAGIYSYMPLLQRSILKLEGIIRREFEKISLQEVSMPYAIPGDLWRESGRWDKMGPLMIKFGDRKKNDFCLGPTHEEVVVDTVRGLVNSYKQLPFTLYQIGPKFRDETRPRFGLMRGREFLMMDAYSFGKDDEDLNTAYEEIGEAYNKIFSSCGLRFVKVDADTGAIGGKASHEYHVLAQSGEDEILSAEDGSYGANVEKAPTPSPALQTEVSGKSWGVESQGLPEEIATPNAASISDVSKLLNHPAHLCVKTLVFEYLEEVGGAWKPVVIYVAGNRDLNEVKLTVQLAEDGVQVLDLRAMSVDNVEKLFGAKVGYLGPLNGTDALKASKTYFDRELFAAHELIVGANKEGFHIKNVELQRDLGELYPESLKQNDCDLVTVTPGEPCSESPTNSPYRSDRGIEVGHIFKLGSVYSSDMKGEFTSKDGRPAPYQMGCYGLGVTRTIAASIEQNHDEAGIIWPKALAPYEVVLISLAKKPEEDAAVFSEKLYRELKEQGVDVAWDDRDMGPGPKFKDADLVGYPLRVTVGARGLQNGELEWSYRRSPSEKNSLTIPGEDFSALAGEIQKLLAEV